MSNKKSNIIDFYFDFLSPYSYFAWLNHEKVTDSSKVVFNYKPVLMGKLFTHFDFKGPGEVLPKREYELKKCFRYAHRNHLTFNPPHKHPFNPMGIVRLACLSASKGDVKKQKEVISLLFELIWKKGIVLEDPEVVNTKLTERFDQEVSQGLIDLSSARESKLELKQNIKDAINSNIFGVPSFKVDHEIFWGNDSFEDLNAYITTGDEWDVALFKKLVNQ